MAYVQGTFDRDHVLLTWGGVLPGAETWSCSVKLANPSSDATSSLANAFLADIILSDWVEDSLGPAVAEFHASTYTGIHNTAKLTFVKASRIGTNGFLKTPVEYNTYSKAYANIAGGSSANAHPLQIALVVSLTTDVNTGSAHRGRFYLPMPALVVQTDGRISAAEAGYVADAAATFITAISDNPGVDLPYSPGAVVMSRKSGAPKTRKVEGVSVGRVFDTQRRRRENLIEDYQNRDVDQGAF